MDKNIDEKLIKRIQDLEKDDVCDVQITSWLADQEDVLQAGHMLVVYKHDTEKALLVELPDNHVSDGSEQWIPLSQIRNLRKLDEHKMFDEDIENSKNSRSSKNNKNSE